MIEQDVFIVFLLLQLTKWQLFKHPIFLTYLVYYMLCKCLNTGDLSEHKDDEEEWMKYETLFK